MNKTVRNIKIGIIVTIIFIVVGYSFYQARNLIQGPSIKISNPQNGATLYRSLVEIKGIAKNTSFITLDDKPIYIDEQGNFNEKLLLSYGYNIIEIKARDKFGKEKKEVLEVVYK